MESNAQGLQRRVLAQFTAGVEEDERMTALWEAAHGGSQDVSYADAYDFAIRAGEKLSAAFGAVQGELPESIDAAFADTLLREALGGDHALVSDMAASVQQALNGRAGLGLKAVAAPLDTDRIEGLIAKLAGYGKAEDALWLLEAPIINFSQGIVDDTLKANVDFQGKSGLRPRVVRTMHGKGCKWCQALAGAYDYPDVPKDVYRRHERCRCTAEYDPGAGKRVQDVWTKRWTTAEERDKIEARKQIGLNTAYETAKNGGRHKGVYVDAVKKRKAALKKSIESHLAQVEIHRDKLSHPEKYDAGWHLKDDRAKKGLLNKWQKDMKRNQEQAEIEQAVWKERFENDDQ